MSVTKRGLLAPQNTFLENICRRVNPQNSNFIVANGRIVNYPVVYCTEAFAKLFGYDRAEVMLKSATCAFLFGEMTDESAAKKLEGLFESQTKDSLEILLYCRNRKPIWVLYYVAPIYNEREKVVLYVCTAKDITSAKMLETDDLTKGLGRFARLARTVTRKAPTSQSSVNLSSNNGSIAGSTNNLSIRDDPAKGSSFTSHLEEVEYPRYMLEAPKTPPYTILHTSTFKQTWDWVLFMLTVYTAIMVPFEIVYALAQEDVFVGIIDLCVDTAFIIDIVISFRTTYVHIGGEVVSDSKRIRNNYIKGWFTLDLISSVPLEMIDMIIEQIDTKEKAIFTQLRLIKLVRLLRLVRVIRRLDHYMEYAGGQLLMFLSIFLLFAHWFALVWYSIGISERDKDYNWINELKATYGADYTWDGSKTANASVVFTSYVSSLYFTMSSMTSIGFGNIAGNTNTEKIFCIILMFVGSLLYATIFGNVTTMFQQMSSQSTRYHEMLNDIREFMKLYQVPKDLSERVMDYVVSTWAMTKGVNTEKVMNYTPKDMRADLSIHLNRHILREHPAFRLASEGCLRALAIAFEMHHSAPGDLLFHTGESIEELCFIASGSLEVIQDEEVVAILGKGDVIGDKFWVEPSVGQSAVNVRALTYTDLHIISRDALVEILRFYESFANSFARNLVLAFNLRQRVRFKKLVDLRKEQEMAAKKENPVDLPPDHPVRKLFSRFRGKLATGQPEDGAKDHPDHTKQNGVAGGARSEDEKTMTSPLTSPTSTPRRKSSPMINQIGARTAGGGLGGAIGAKRSMWQKLGTKHSDPSNSSDVENDSDHAAVRTRKVGAVPNLVLDDAPAYDTSDFDQQLKEIDETDPLISNLLSIRQDLVRDLSQLSSKLQKLEFQIIKVHEDLRVSRERANRGLLTVQSPVASVESVPSSQTHHLQTVKEMSSPDLQKQESPSPKTRRYSSTKTPKDPKQGLKQASKQKLVRNSHAVDKSSTDSLEKTGETVENERISEPNDESSTAPIKKTSLSILESPSSPVAEQVGSSPIPVSDTIVVEEASWRPNFIDTGERPVSAAAPEF